MRSARGRLPGSHGLPPLSWVDRAHPSTSSGCTPFDFAQDRLRYSLRLTQDEPWPDVFGTAFDMACGLFRMYAASRSGCTPSIRPAAYSGCIARGGAQGWSEMGRGFHGGGEVTTW